MVLYRAQSQFCRHVITPVCYYLGIALLCCVLVFAYFLLKNAFVAPPMTVQVVEVGDAAAPKPTLLSIMTANSTTAKEVAKDVKIPAGAEAPKTVAPAIPRVLPSAVGPEGMVQNRINEPPNLLVPDHPIPNIIPNQAVPPQRPLMQPAAGGVGPHEALAAAVGITGEAKKVEMIKQDDYEFAAYFNPSFLRKERISRKPREGRGEPGTDSYYKIPEQLNTIVKINNTAFKSRTCTNITGRRIVMNYAHNCCKKSQPLNCATALAHGFDICIQFNQSSIDPWFLDYNQQVFQATTMAGYGVWKSFLIMRLLMTLDDDDVLFYSDSGAKFVDSAEDYFCLMEERNQDVVVFSVGLPEDQYAKGDALLVTGCSTDECKLSQQRLGGYSMYRKSMVAFHFLSVWLTFNTDLRVVSDQPSKLTTNQPSFKANRHDQTALSLASKRCGIPEWPDPSQWGANGYNHYLRNKEEFKKIAKTIIDCTRDKS